MADSVKTLSSVEVNTAWEAKSGSLSNCTASSMLLREVGTAHESTSACANGPSSPSSQTTKKPRAGDTTRRSTLDAAKMSILVARHFMLPSCTPSVRSATPMNALVT